MKEEEEPKEIEKEGRKESRKARKGPSANPATTTRAINPLRRCLCEPKENSEMQARATLWRPEEKPERKRAGKIIQRKCA